MSSLEEARSQFYTALEGLKEVHTREELDIQRKMVEDSKNLLLKIDPEFKLMIEENKRKRKIESDKIGAEYRAKYRDKISEVKSKVSQAYACAESDRITTENRIEEWVKTKVVKKSSLKDFKDQTKFKQPETIKDMISERVTKSYLICPICSASDRGNSINGVPACMNCMHKLVTKSELNKYNRDYRRQWKRKRGKML